MSLAISAQSTRSSTSSITDSPTSKIRDSCQACAVSKVKCDKKKPSCSRCTRREMSCTYLVKKRPGRKRDSDVNVRPDFLGEQSSWLVTGDPDRNPLRPDSVLEAECSSATVPNADSEIFMPFEPTPLFDEFGTSPMLELFNSDTLYTGDLAQEYNFYLEKLLMPDNIDMGLVSDISSLDLPATSQSSSPYSNSQSPSSSISHTAVSDAIDLTDSSCNCVIEALDFMKKFSSTKREPCTTSNVADGTAISRSTILSKNSPAQDVIVENRETVEAVSQMLRCSCVEDVYMLTMLSTIVFKILGRYAAAASHQPVQKTKEHENKNKSSSTNITCHPDDEFCGRRAAQLILSELHRVQRLVSQLSTKLKASGVGAASAGGETSVKDAGGDSKAGSDRGMAMVSFSATTLDQMEADLRRCLSTLSSEIINKLRQS